MVNRPSLAHVAINGRPALRPPVSRSAPVLRDLVPAVAEASAIAALLQRLFTQADTYDPVVAEKLIADLTQLLDDLGKDLATLTGDG